MASGTVLGEAVGSQGSAIKLFILGRPHLLWTDTTKQGVDAVLAAKSS